MQIHVVIKNVYGNETIYPNCEKSKILASMLKQKTFTKFDISHIKALGFKIIVDSLNPYEL